MKTLKIFVTGVVQGVFFRRFIFETAKNLNIRGYVRNLSDGRVEIIAEGRDEKVNDFFESCKQGNKYAKIDKIDFEEMKHQDLKEFKILKI